MSVLPEKKLKQARLSFNTTPPAKKRKHDDETNRSDLCKFRKTHEGPELEQNCSFNVGENVNTKENEISTEDKQNVTSVPATREIKSKIDRFVIRRQSRSGPEAENMDVVAVTGDPPVKSDAELVSEISKASNTSKVPAKLRVDADVDATVDVAASDMKAIGPTLVADISISESDTSLNTSELASDGNSDRNKSHDFLLKKRITPKQLLKKQEAEARRLEREKIKKEKEQKRLEEKEMKEKKRLAEIEAKNEEKRQKEEEKRQKEEEKRLKEEERKAKEEEKRKLKEEEKRLKEEERKAKEEERKAKEEERKAKEEERKLKMEEKQKKEELEKKHKEKIAAAFTNFFLPKKSTQSKTVENVEKPQTSRFMPFEVKADMKLADVTRASLVPEQKTYLDHILESSAEPDLNSLYLARLKSDDYKPGHSEDTWPLNLNDDDDDLKNDGTLGNDARTCFRGKLFQFAENRRPAYWGTWRKHSKSISGRTPFKCDSEFFEYDIDSDEEWVEEPGESLHGSDDEKESDHEYEVDNDFFVPHGYLSDEEAQNDDIKHESPKAQKLKLNILEKEFEAELNEKTLKLKSRHYGCIWIPNSVDRNEGADDVENLLLSFRAVWNDEASPFCLKTESPCSSTQTTPSTKTKTLSEFPEQLIPDLIRLIHGNKNSRKNLATEFVSYVSSKDPSTHLASLCVRKKMKEISSWQVTACCWSVNDEVRAVYNLGELSSSSNDWKYVSAACTQTQIRKGQKQNDKPPSVDLSAQVVAAPVVKHNSIAKFVKKLTPEERERQLKAAVVEKKTEPISPIVQSPVAAEPKRKDNPEEGKPAKKRAVLFTMKKDGVWTWNTGPSSAAATAAEKGYEADPKAKNSSENVTVTESAAVAERGSVIPESDARTTPSVCVAVNGASSTIVTTSAAEQDTKSQDENSLLESGNALPASGSTDVDSNGHERAELLAGVASSVSSSENTAVTVKQGRKYATLITVGKLRE